MKSLNISLAFLVLTTWSICSVAGQNSSLLITSTILNSLNNNSNNNTNDNNITYNAYTTNPGPTYLSTLVTTVENLNGSTYLINTTNSSNYASKTTTLINSTLAIIISNNNLDGSTLAAIIVPSIVGSIVLIIILIALLRCYQKRLFCFKQNVQEITPKKHLEQEPIKLSDGIEMPSNLPEIDLLSLPELPYQTKKFTAIEPAKSESVSSASNRSLSPVSIKEPTIVRNASTFSIKLSESPILLRNQTPELINEPEIVELTKDLEPPLIEPVLIRIPTPVNLEPETIIEPIDEIIPVRESTPIIPEPEPIREPAPIIEEIIPNRESAVIISKPMPVQSQISFEPENPVLIRVPTPITQDPIPLIPSSPVFEEPIALRLSTPIIQEAKPVAIQILDKHPLDLLRKFKIIFIIDDSSSMNENVERPILISNSKPSKWEELKFIFKKLIEIIPVLSDSKVYFLNKWYYGLTNISDPNEMLAYLDEQPLGTTPVGEVFDRVLTSNLSEALEQNKRLLIVFLTDAQPTNSLDLEELEKLAECLAKVPSDVNTSILDFSQDNQAKEYLNRICARFSNVNSDHLEALRLQINAHENRNGSMVNFGDYLEQFLIKSANFNL